MSPEPQRHDPLAISLIALATVTATLGYTPWTLASIIVAITLRVTAVAEVRPGLAARRAGGIGVMLLIPAGLQVRLLPPIPARLQPPPRDPPLGAAWHLDALTRYPALLIALAITAAALLAAIALTYVHIPTPTRQARHRRLAAGRRSLRPILSRTAGAVVAEPPATGEKGEKPARRIWFAPWLRPKSSLNRGTAQSQHRRPPSSSWSRCAP